MSRESAISPLVRPALLLTVAFATFGVAFLSGAVEGFAPGFGLRFGLAVMEVMAKVPAGVLDLFGLMFSAYAIGKSGERAVTAWTAPRPPAAPNSSEGDAA